jgi:toxin ParE1/3/4
MPRVLKTPRAEKDLVAIGRHIAMDNPRAAARMLERFQESFDIIARFPNGGTARDELAEGLRSFPVGNYLIFYLPFSDGVSVVRVLHGARNLRRIFRRGDA